MISKIIYLYAGLFQNMNLTSSSVSAYDGVGIWENTYMKSAPVQERAFKKRTKIIEAAGLEFSEKGYEMTTAKSITSRAGVATGTFYQHFDNKDEVLHELTRQRLTNVFLDLPVWEPGQISAVIAVPNSKKIFRDALEMIYDVHAKDPGLHEVIEQRRFADSKLEAIMEKGEAALRRRVEDFVRHFGCQDVETVAFCLFAMAEGIVHRHVFTHSKLGKDAVIDTGVAMLVAYFEATPKREASDA